MSARNYDRPDLDQRRGRLALYVDGSLGSVKPSLAYEGRLQIHNAIGAATVEQIDGDALPPGSSLYVDQDTMEVVIAWPAYSETDAPIQNGGFDSDTGWIRGAGWSISGGQGVYTGQGDSYLESSTFYPVQPQQFAAQVNVQQGASSAGNTSAGIAVRYYDADKTLLATQIGSVITSGKNGAWHLSTGNFTTVDATYLRPAIMGTRRRQNLPMWVDDASWGYQSILGINTEETINLTIRVKDSAGRTALWKGSVEVVASVLFAATGAVVGMIRSSTDGVTWTQVNTGLDVFVYRVDVCNGRLYASGLRKVAVSSDGGSTFTTATGLSPTDDIIGIASDETSGVVVLVTTNNHVYRSTDGFAFAAATNFDGTKYVIQGAPGKVFVGSTNNTLKVTADGGVTWSAQSSNLPLSNGSYTDVLSIKPYELGYLASGTSEKHIFRSTTGAATSWTLGANIGVASGGNVSLGANGLEVMIVYSAYYRLSTDGGVTIGAQTALSGGLSVGAPQGANRIVYRDGFYYSSASTGVMRYKLGSGWALVLNEVSTGSPKPCVALLT